MFTNEVEQVLCSRVKTILIHITSAMGLGSGVRKMAKFKNVFWSRTTKNHMYSSCSNCQNYLREVGQTSEPSKKYMKVHEYANKIILDYFKVPI